MIILMILILYNTIIIIIIIIIITAIITTTKGLFEFFMLGKPLDSEQHIVNAMRAYETQLGSQHTSTLHVASVLNLVKQHSLQDVALEGA